MKVNYFRRNEGRKGGTGREEIREGGSMTKLERHLRVGDFFPVLYSI